MFDHGDSLIRELWIIHAEVSTVICFDFENVFFSFELGGLVSRGFIFEVDVIFIRVD